MSKLIYVTRRIPEIGINIMKEMGYLIDIRENEQAPAQEELIQALSQKPYDGIVTLLTDHIDSNIFDICPTIKIVAQYSVGTDNINLMDAKQKGVTVTNTPNSSSLAVAEQVVALTLALTTRSVEGDRYVRDGKYTGWSPYLFEGTDLTGKTVGIIGGGSIGQEVASILHFGFKCDILYTDVLKNENMEEKYKAKFLDKDTLLSSSDIVSLHVPLLPSTHHLIDAKSLSLMKKSAFLINTSRGPVVDEVALVKALKEGVIKGAGLDVYEFEPKLSEGLKDLQNVVLTPHIASARESVRSKMSEIVANNIVSFFEKGKALNEIKI